MDVMPDAFTPLARDASLSERVGREIEALISNGVLKTDQRLPAERELASQFGVSRTVIREAVKGLSARGLLSVTQGRGGTMVRSPSSNHVSGMMSMYLRNAPLSGNYRDLIEMRQVLEVEIAGKAALRHSPNDIEDMEANLQRMRGLIAQRDMFADADFAFHLLVARASGNSLYGLLLKSVNDLMLDVRRAAFRVHGAPRYTLSEHRAILVAVRAGDEAAARNAMLAHIKRGALVLQKALALQNAVMPPSASK